VYGPFRARSSASSHASPFFGPFRTKVPLPPLSPLRTSSHGHSAFPTARCPLFSFPAGPFRFFACPFRSGGTRPPKFAVAGRRFFFSRGQGPRGCLTRCCRWRYPTEGRFCRRAPRARRTRGLRGFCPPQHFSPSSTSPAILDFETMALCVFIILFLSALFIGPVFWFSAAPFSQVATVGKGCFRFQS